jgi:hypothetical protein
LKSIPYVKLWDSTEQPSSPSCILTIPGALSILSFQIFQSVIFDHEDGIRPFSSAERIKTASTTLTFRAGTGYLGDTILPDIFFAYDPEGYYAVNPAISYVPPGNERIRLSLIGAIYGGRNKFKSSVSSLRRTLSS